MNSKIIITGYNDSLLKLIISLLNSYKSIKSGEKKSLISLSSPTSSLSSNISISTKYYETEIDLIGKSFQDLEVGHDDIHQNSEGLVILLSSISNSDEKQVLFTFINYILQLLQFF